MRRSARLRSVMSRSTKILPWKRGSALDELGRGNRHGNRLPARRADDRLARLADDTLGLERRAVLVRHQRHELQADQLVRPVAEQRRRRRCSRCAPRPSGAVTSTASLMLFNSVSR